MNCLPSLNRLEIPPLLDGICNSADFLDEQTVNFLGIPTLWGWITVIFSFWNQFKRKKGQKFTIFVTWLVFP
jgi:hypothetical protein